MSFDTLQQRINRTALTRLGSAVLLDAVTVQARFDSAYALGKVGDIGMASNAPSLVLLSSDTPADPIGLAVVVDGISYSVVGQDPAGAGMTRLWLEQA